MPWNAFGLTPTQNNRLEITLTESDGSALRSVNIQTSEGTNIEVDKLYIEWNEDLQGYKLFDSSSVDAEQIIIAQQKDGENNLKLKVSNSDLDDRKAVNIQAMNLEQVLRTSEGDIIEGLYAYTFTPSTTNGKQEYS